jgi:hypothetical protein
LSSGLCCRSLRRCEVGESFGVSVIGDICCWADGMLERRTHVISQGCLVVGLSEHFPDIKAVGLCELARRLPSSLRIKDPLHRVEHVAAIFRRGKVGQRSMLVYCGHNLRNLGFHGLFGVLDLFDLFIALLGQIRQIVLEAHHAVVGAAIGALLDTVLFSNPPRLILTLPENIAEIVSRIALLFGERTRLRVAQHAREI